MSDPTRKSTAMYRFKNKAGEYRWIETTFTNMIGNEAVNGIVLNFHDITERRLAKEALEESDWKFRALFEKGPIGVAYHVMVNDSEDKPVNYFFLDANKSYQELTGVDPRGKMVTEAFPGIENDPFDWIGTFGRVARKGESVRFETFLQSNKRWYDCVGYQYKPNHFVSAFTDITKRKEAELSLKETNEKLFQANIELVESKEKAEESEMRFKTLHNATFGGIAIHDKGIIWDCNQGLSEITGYSTDELNGMDGLLLIAESSRELVMNNILTEYEKPYEVDGLRKNGEHYPLRLEARKIPYRGKMMRSVEFRDITLQKKIEKDLILAKEKAEESDRLKTAFLANMSHEIRTPMNGILGFTNLLSEPGLTNEEKSGFISIIQKSGERMLNTVNDLIDISKIETGQVKLVYEEININLQVLYLFGFFEFQAKEKNLTITLKNNIPDNFAIVKTDITKFDSILSNLIKNAIKYTEVGTIEIGCSRQNQQLEFYVRDTGIGIPKHRHQAIFNRFEQADIGGTRAFQGSGLGLAIAKANTEMLGGKIWLESEPETGSTFYFNILSENGEIEIDNRLEYNGIGGSKKTGGKIKLLIAEDDEAGYFYLVTILKPLDCEIIRYFTGTETVEKCRKNNDIDIILMDIRMPEMNGYDATQRIREFNKDVIVIAQTAFALLGDKEKALNVGCNEYISKPIKRKELIELIQKYVNK
jgi:PAS domain S-box-containing protein